MAQQIVFSIVTAVWNQPEYTLHFFDSVKENSTRPYEFIVVDNGSDDPTKSWLKTQKINKLIRWEENLGTTKAWNEGIKAASGKYIIVINNDVLVGPQWLEGLEEVLESNISDLASLSPSTNDVLYSLNISLNNEGKNIFKQKAQELQSQPAVLFSYSLIGSCIVIPRSTIKTIGLFDERYFAYYNDLDYALSIVAAGLKTYTTTKSTIYHFGGASGKSHGISEKKETDKQKFLAKWSQLRNFLNQYHSQLT